METTTEVIATPFTEWYAAPDQLVNLSRADRVLIQKTTAPQNAVPAAYPDADEEWAMFAIFGGVPVQLWKGPKPDVELEFRAVSERLMPR